jgi:hypothetical protein
MSLRHQARSGAQTLTFDDQRGRYTVCLRVMLVIQQALESHE